MELQSLINSLSLIDAPRSDKNKRYPLPLLLLIAFCASISKHDLWYTMQYYQLLHELDVTDAFVSLDALGCQLWGWPSRSWMLVVTTYSKSKTISPACCRS